MNESNNPCEIMESAPGPVVRVNGDEYLHFAGTAYLGLQYHPEVIAAARDALNEFGLHTATSRALFGTSPSILSVEQRAAAFLHCEDTVYFPSGYLCASAIIAAFNGQYDVVFLDEATHESTQSALRGVAENVVTFSHQDPNDLCEKLNQQLPKGSRPLVLCDGVTAIFGHVAPVRAYHELLESITGSILCVDDSHAVGVIGPQGQGSFESAGLSPTSSDIRLEMFATLSKAIGGFGGVVAGKRSFTDGVRGAAGSYRCSTPAPNCVAAATAKALEIVATRPELRDELRSNTRLLKKGLMQIGIQAQDSDVPVVAIEFNNRATAQSFQGALRKEGILVAEVGSYDPENNNGVVRLTVFATHTVDMIDRLIETIGKQQLPKS